MDPSQEDDGQQGLEERERILFEVLAEQIAASIDPREARRRGEGGLEAIAHAAMSLLERLRPGEFRVRVATRAPHPDGRTTIEDLVVIRASQYGLAEDRCRTTVERFFARWFEDEGGSAR